MTSPWPPISTLISSSPTNANGSTRLNTPTVARSLPFVTVTEGGRVTRISASRLCRSRRCVLRARADDRLAHAVEEDVLEAIVEIGRHVQIVGAVLGAARHQRDRVGMDDDERQMAIGGRGVGQPRLVRLRIRRGLHVERQLDELEIRNRARRSVRRRRSDAAARLSATSRTAAGAAAMARRAASARRAAIACGVIAARSSRATRPVGSTTAICPRTGALPLVQQARPERERQREQRREDEHADHEAARHHGGEELAAGDVADALHAVAPAWPSFSEASRAGAGAPPSDTRLMKMSSSRGRASSMRAGVTAAVMRRIAAPGSEPSASRMSKPAAAGSTCSTSARRAKRREIRRRVERLEPDRPRIVAPPDRRHAVVEHLVAAMDHHDVLAHLFGLRHHVGREQDGRAAPVLLVHEVAQQPRADRIEAR